MGDTLNSLGLGIGGSTPKSGQATASAIQKMRIKGAGKFEKTFSKTAWRKGVGKSIKTKDGSVSADDFRDKIIGYVRKAGIRGVSGKQLEEKFYKDMGIEKKMRNRLMKELSSKYVTASETGLTPEQIKTNVKLGYLLSEKEMYRGSAGKLTNNRTKQKTKDKFKNTDSSAINVKQAKYKIGIAGDEKSEGDLRGIHAADDYDGNSSGFAGKGAEFSVGVAGNHGPKEDGTMKMFQSFGHADGFQIKKAG